MKSFAEVHPELVPEWADSNGDYRPENISYGSNQKIIWIGRCGHEWEATVKNRSNGSGCPFCSGNQVLYGFNDLASADPELAAEWSELNYPLYPSSVTVKANKKVWWRCRNCGQQWQARIADRTEGSGCPVCSGAKLVPGINDFATENPELAAEWSNMNDQLKPSMVWTKSRRNVWWECKECGYKWRGVIDSRVKGQKCPACAVRAARSARPVQKKYKQSEIMNLAVKYYADRSKEEYFTDEVETIGIPMQIYFPKAKLTLEFSDGSINNGARRRWENAKNWLCLNSRIRLVRILAPGTEEFDNCICITMIDDSFESFSAAIEAAFKLCGIHADVDIERDMLSICAGKKDDNI